MGKEEGFTILEEEFSCGRVDKETEVVKGLWLGFREVGEDNGELKLELCGRAVTTKLWVCVLPVVVFVSGRVVGVVVPIVVNSRDMDVGAVDVTGMCVNGIGVPVGFVVE